MCVYLVMMGCSCFRSGNDRLHVFKISGDGGLCVFNISDDDGLLYILDLWW